MKNVDDIYALTPMQRLMLLHAAAGPQRDVLVNRVGYEIRGVLHVQPLREALRALIERHPALRTAVLWKGLEHPVQVVRTEVPVPLRELDLSEATPEERTARIDELWEEEAVRPFELGTAPLMRCTLARLEARRHFLLWSIHHLVADRWSHRVLVSELSELYGAGVRGEAAQLPPAPGFREYVAWVRRLDSGEAERFWRGALAGLRRPTLLAGAKTPSPGSERRQLRRALTEEGTGALERRAVEWRIPLAPVVLAALAAAAAARTRSRDVVVGLTVSGRPPDLPGVEGIVGSFVNNVPARIRLDPDTPVGEWVRGIARAQGQRQPHEHVSPATILDWTELPPSEPLFDLLVVLNLAPPEEGAGDLVLHPVRATLASGYPLTLGVSREGGRLVLQLVHPASFLEADALLDEIVGAAERLAATEGGARLEELAPRLGTGSRVGGPADPPRSSPELDPGRGMGAALLAIWREVLGTEEVGLDDDFFALGGTSLQAARVFALVERRTGRSLPLSTLVGAPSVRALLAAMDEPVEPTGPLVTLRRDGGRVPVFAVPGIGGGVVGLLPLSRELDAHRPFHAFQCRGYDGREEPLGSIDAIADHFVAAMPETAEGGFHLMGACWGAAVAFEMAGKLRARGTPPTSLTLLEPAVLTRRRDTSASRPWLDFALRRVRLYRDELMEADWSERKRFLSRKALRAARFFRSGGLPPETRSEVDRSAVREANRRAIERYDPEPLTARSRVFVTTGRGLAGSGDPRLEWRSLLEPAPEVVPVPGRDSGDAITENVVHFAAALRDWLREAERR